MSWKFLDFQGLQTLAGIINKIKQTADESSSAVSELESDFKEFSTLIVSALEEINTKFQEVPDAEISSDDVDSMWEG